MSLEPIKPEEAVELYLADRETELADATLSAHQSRLGFFVKWCEENEIRNLNELTGRKLHQYRLWRRNDGDLAPPSEKSQMDTLRVFVRWLEFVDGADPDLHQKVRVPSITPEQNSRDVKLERDEAEAILEYLETYEYASVEHVTLSLLWRTMMRRSAAHALDVGNYDPEEQCIEVIHRPETGTPIKNGGGGERLVALSRHLCMLLDDWIRDRRPDVEDGHGRRPLIASARGRTSKSTIAKYCYRYTRPCAYREECPHDRDPDSCEAIGNGRESRCPSSVSPHAVRRGSITHHLNSDVPETAMGDRANVSQDVLEQHYDRRTKREKMEQRREYLNNV